MGYRVSVTQMVEALYDVWVDSPDQFSSWANEFIPSVKGQIEGKRGTTKLTEKQVTQIERLYSSHIGD